MLKNWWIGKGRATFWSHIFRVHYQHEIMNYAIFMQFTNRIKSRNLFWDARTNLIKFHWILLHLVEMVPDPTRAYFWPIVNKRLTRFWPGVLFDPTRRDFFFDPDPSLPSRPPNIKYLANFCPSQFHDPQGIPCYPKVKGEGGGRLKKHPRMQCPWCC